MSSCFFIGHRETSEEVLTALANAVEHHITQYGVTEFFVGHYGGFDRMAAQTVIKAKERHPEITLSMLLPYHPKVQPIQIPEGFDNTFYPPGMEIIPRKYAIIHANQYMVDHVDHVISYVWHTASNSRNLLIYAKAHGTKVYNLYFNR